MPPAPIPFNEAARLGALHELGILDSPSDAEFDAIAQAAALACGVPMSVISLIGDDRQYFKAQVGFGSMTETPRDTAFCAHTILGTDMVEVSDARYDARFQDNPGVLATPGIRFYAGVPLRLGNGHHVGTLCVVDDQPRSLDDAQRTILRNLAVAAECALQSWGVRQERRRVADALDQERQRMALLIAATDAGTWEWNVQTGELRLNERWASTFGWTLEELAPVSIHTRHDMVHPDDLPGSIERLERHFAGLEKQYEHECRMRHRDGRWIWVRSRGTVMIRTADGQPHWMFGTVKDIDERKRQENALRTSEEFLERTGRLAGVGGWELELATGTLTWSAETYRIHGVDPAWHPTTDAAIAFYAPEARPVIRAAVERGAEGVGWDLELPFIQAGGRAIWVRAVGSAVFADGKAVRLVGAIQDVTERVLERLALEKATERTRLATESARIGIWEWDLRSHAITWDAAMHRMYGLTQDGGPVSYAVWQQHLHPDDRDAAEAALWTAVKGGKPFEAAFRILWADGSLRYLRAAGRVICDAQGAAARMVGVQRDTTDSSLLEVERNRHAARLAEGEANFRLLAENASDMISWVGPDGSRRYISPAVTSLFGVTPEVLMECGALSLIHPDDVTGIAALQSALLDGVVTEGTATFRILHPERGEVWAEVNARSMPGPCPSRPAGYISVSRDVTERVRLQTEQEGRAQELRAVNLELERMARHLVRARDAADRASQAKSHFLAGMSHELRTPLNGILGYARLLRLEGGLTDVQAGRIDSMLDAGQHLLDMINSVLDLSEIESDRLEMRPIEVDLRRIAAASLDLVRPGAAAKGLLLSMATSFDAPPRLVTDPLRLRQILLNLLGNAVKFTDGAVVELRLRTMAGDAAMRIEVADTGPGIEPEERGRLFQDFERLRANVPGATEGAGLGLALSARLATLLGGRLGHDDNPGGGSVFWLELPLDIAAAPPGVAGHGGAGEDIRPRGSALARPAVLRPIRVLVVDDVAMNRDIACSFLRVAGHAATCVEGGADAVAAVITGEFDVILMDVRMPEVDGLEATRRIRALGGARSQAPIIGLTAQAFAEQVEACMQAGMDGHLSKPYTPEDLIAAVLNAAAMGDARASSRSMHGAAPPPMTGPVLPVLDPVAAERVAGYLAPAAIATYRKTIAARCEDMLENLRQPDALQGADDVLADAAHTLAGTAGDARVRAAF